MLALSIGIGVASGSQPIIGFNYGARQCARVKRTFRLSAIAATVITSASWVIFQLFPLQLIRIFARNPPSMRSLPWTVSTSTCSW